MIREPAYAKINLFLEIAGRLPNGYHHLQSLMVFADVGEWIDVAPADDDALTITGPEASTLSSLPGDNLVSQAAKAFTQALGSSAAYDIVLHKEMPVSSGIGGGSADAAAVLRALNRLNDMALDLPALMQIAQGLGADVPVCLLSQASILNGAATELSAAKVEGCDAAVLVNPRKTVSTAEVFAAYGACPVGYVPIVEEQIWTTETISARSNDLTHVAAGLCPDIMVALKALNDLPGAKLSRMSGSGATCFTLFDSSQHADAAAALLRRTMPSWWCRRADLGAVLGS